MIIKSDTIFSASQNASNGCCLFIRKGIIDAISPYTANLKKHKILDFSGYTLSPTFCDYHLHISKKNLDRYRKITAQLIKHGINTVFEGGDSHCSGLQWKRLAKNKINVKVSGWAIYRKGDYGSFLGSGVSTLSEAKGVIKKLGALGADYIKIINSGILEPATGRITKGGFRRAELEEMIKFSTDLGLKVFCHANGDKAVTEAVKAGASVIVHGFSISEDSLMMMAKKNVPLIPTVNAFLSLEKKYTQPQIKYKIEKISEEHLRTVKKASVSGIKILAGSDAGPSFIPYGKSLRNELLLFKKVGFTNEQVLSTTISEPFQEGKKANFLVLQGLKIKKLFLKGKEIVTTVPLD